MVLFTALAVGLASVPPAQSQARASVRIASPQRVGKAEWGRTPTARRREKILIEGGRRLTMRLIELE